MARDAKGKKRRRDEVRKKPHTAHAAPLEGNDDMAADPSPVEGPVPNHGDTAPIRAVTAAMMEHAAREAARLADGVAHHADPRGARPAETAPGAPVADTEAADAVPAAPRAAEAAAGPADGAPDVDPGLPRSVATLQSYNAKLFDIWENNVAATGAFLAALMDAKTLPEALQVNADHMTRGLQTLTGQSRDLAELAQKVALGALRPFDEPSDGA